MSDDPENPIMRAVTALERMADALERQAAVMEADVEEEVTEVTDTEARVAEVVQAYGKVFGQILDMPNAFNRSRGLRQLAGKMMKHGSQTETQARQR